MQRLWVTIYHRSARAIRSNLSSCCQRPRFHLDRQLIDLRRQDEIVLRQPADRVRPQFDPYVAVAFDVQVRVMAIGLGQFGTAIEKLHAGHEVFHFPILANPLAIVRDPPAWKLLQLLPGFLRRIGFDAALTRFALLLNQFGGRLNGH